MKNILLATDLASETDRALERAVQLAATMMATLHILHVSSPDSSSGRTKSTSAAKQKAEGRLQKYLAGNPQLKELQSSTVVVESREPFVEIIKLADNVDAELIVMGLHGKATLRDLFVGTTIEKVIRKGTKPVLMVKDKPHGDYKNLLVGTDFSANSSQALQVALELVPNGFLTLVHSYDIPDTSIGDKIIQYAGDVIATTAKANLEAFVQEHSKFLPQFVDQPKQLKYRVTQGEAFTCLTREAAAAHADLIAIGVHSQESILPYRIGGKTRDILINPPCDVLVAKHL